MIHVKCTEHPEGKDLGELRRAAGLEREEVLNALSTLSMLAQAQQDSISFGPLPAPSNPEVGFLPGTVSITITFETRKN